MSRANVYELAEWAQSEFGRDGWMFSSTGGEHCDFLHGTHRAWDLYVVVMVVEWAVTWTVYVCGGPADPFGEPVGRGRIDVFAPATQAVPT